MLMFQRSPAMLLLWMIGLWGVSPACVNNKSHVLPTVSRGVRDAQIAGTQTPLLTDTTDDRQDDAGRNENPEDGREIMATVDGHAIKRHRMVDLLLRSYGPGMLEQLVVLERAQRACAARSIVVVQQDIEDEYDRMLRQMIDPLSSMSNATFSHSEAEQMLDTVLLQRNISREEFMIGVRRNAYLRKMVTSESHYTQSQLLAEYTRAYGRRFQVRHIQLASQSQASRVLDELSSGVDFAIVARRYSVNRISADQGGLLDPFSVEDEIVPKAMRDTVERLGVGEVSKPLRIGRWYHIIRLESVVPAVSKDMAGVRDQLIRRLEDRESPEAMRHLYDSLLTGARVKIMDDALRAAWQRKHGAANP